MLICGFETQHASEYSTSSSATLVEGSDGFVTGRYISIATTGYVTWLPDINGQACVSVNARTPSGALFKPIYIDRGAYEFYIQIQGDDTDYTIKLYSTQGGGSATVRAESVITLAENTWTNYVLYSNKDLIEVYVDTKLVLSYIPSMSFTNIAEVSVTNSSNAALLVDDVVAYGGRYNKTIAVVMPYYLGVFGDRSKGLTPSGKGENSSHVDEIPTDSDTTYIGISGANNATDIYIPKMDIATKYGYPLSMDSILGMAVHHISKGGNTNCKAQVYIERNGTTSSQGTGVSLTTSYVLYTEYIDPGTSTPLLVEEFTSENGDTRLYYGIKLTSVVGQYARTSTMIASVACSIRDKPNVPNTLEKTGGFDLRLTAPLGDLASGDSLQVRTNIEGIPVGIAASAVAGQIWIKFSRKADGKIYVTPRIANAVTGDEITLGTAGTYNLRVVMHDEFCSVFYDDIWLYTYAFSYINYPTSLDINLFTDNDTGLTVTNVVLSELSDWREATYIDTETPGMSGIQSVIQQRPVEIVPRSGGTVDFSYEGYRSSVTLSNIYDHAIVARNSNVAGSHIIVYYSDVTIVVDENYLNSYGYLTKVYQMSELDHGAPRAARVAARRAREAMYTHTVRCSTDIRVEPGDIAIIGYTRSGTGTEVIDSMIVENVRIRIEQGRQEMSLEGRDYVAS